MILPDDITLKVAVISMACVIKDCDKFYLWKTSYDESTQRQKFKKDGSK